jgi:hypothetical protein
VKLSHWPSIQSTAFSGQALARSKRRLGRGAEAARLMSDYLGSHRRDRFPPASDLIREGEP